MYMCTCSYMHVHRSSKHNVHKLTILYYQLLCLYLQCMYNSWHWVHVLRAHAYCDRIRTNRAISCNVINIIKLASQFHRFVFVTLLLIRQQQLLTEHQQLLPKRQQLLPKYQQLLTEHQQLLTEHQPTAAPQTPVPAAQTAAQRVANTFQFCLDQQQYYMYMYM